MPSDYYLAAIPEPVTLLGLRLKPFSLGHVVLLHRIESSFVVGGVPTCDDLAASVLICAQDYREAIESFNNPDLTKFMARWFKKLTWRGWFKRRGFVDLEAKAKEFAEYVKNGSKLPYYSFTEADVKESHQEPVQSVKIALMTKTTLTESELMDRPWGLCLQDFIALQVMEGKCQIQDREEIENAQAVAAVLHEKFGSK
jgi:hypothetical protein